VITQQVEKSEPRTASVLQRYDELAELLASADALPVADPAASAHAAVLLAREARLLDGRRFDEWAEWFTDDGVVWVPLPGSAGPLHPARDQALFLDDGRRIRERIAWHTDPSAWGQHPPSRCVRTVGAVEAWSDDGRIVTRSTFTMVEMRNGHSQVVAGTAVHELVGPEPRCRSRILVVPQLIDGLRNPSFLI
jgi:benzoate/toluate 1,2-dioxygenase beta subunit